MKKYSKKTKVIMMSSFVFLLIMILVLNIVFATFASNFISGGIEAVTNIGIDKQNINEEGKVLKIEEDSDDEEADEVGKIDEVTERSDEVQDITKNISTENWDLENVTIEKDDEQIPVPVPKGYVASNVTGEHTIKTGFVIYEGEDEVNDDNKEEAQKTRNQWVWVPIYDASEIYGTDENGQKHGKLYEFNENGRTALNWEEDENGVMKINSYRNREPDLIKKDNSMYLTHMLTEMDEHKLKENLQIEFEETIQSIKKYGGFYIGRYETGKTGGVIKNNKDINGGAYWFIWFQISKALNGTNRNVKTSMIWGSLWDATLEWLVDSGNKKYEDMIDSTNWGLYNNKYMWHSLTTGSNENYKANNIYDLAGNIAEWTLEAKGNEARVMRGGNYNSEGDRAPASYRYDSFYESYNGNIIIGSRAILYIE